MPNSQKETKLSSETVFEGRLLKVRKDKVLLPNGKETTREILEHPHVSAVLPITDEGKILLIRQYRYALGMSIFEIPAGKIDIGENPLDCAKRELSEEIGKDAENFQHLTSIYPSVGYTDKTIHIYLATGLFDKTLPCDDDENIEVFAFTKDEVLEMIKAKAIEDGKTLCALLSYFLEF